LLKVNHYDIVEYNIEYYLLYIARKYRNYCKRFASVNKIRKF